MMMMMTMTSNVNETESSKLKFRNYVPKDKKLREHCIPPSPSVSPHLPVIEKYVQKEPFDPTMFSRPPPPPLEAFPSPFWDLERDLNPQIDELKRKTELALLELRHQALAELSSSESGEDDHSHENED